MFKESSSREVCWKNCCEQIQKWKQQQKKRNHVTDPEREPSQSDEISNQSGFGINDIWLLSLVTTN